MKITFANWGNYTIVFKTLFENLGLDYIVPDKTNPEAIEEGSKLSPELYCFPFKVNVGNYLSALRRGADTILMWENIGGSCRLRYYWIVQEKILREAGFNVKVLNLNSKNLFSRAKELKKETRTSIWQTIPSLLLALREFRFVEKIEEKACYLRPREKKSNEINSILEQALERLEGVARNKEFSQLRKETWQKFSKIQIDKNRDVPRVEIIGEIYTICDGVVNFDLEKKLGKMGIEVHRGLNISYFIKSNIFPWIEWRMQKKINPYLKSTVGGHGRQAIEEMLDCVKKDFDGIIHLLPFGCMPETTVRPILEKIHQESGIPFLSLSLDEQVAEAAINTRLEAFVDVVKNYHQRKRKL